MSQWSNDHFNSMRNNMMGPGGLLPFPDDVPMGHQRGGPRNRNRSMDDRNAIDMDLENDDGIDLNPGHHNDGKFYGRDRRGPGGFHGSPDRRRRSRSPQNRGERLERHNRNDRRERKQSKWDNDVARGDPEMGRLQGMGGPGGPQGIMGGPQGMGGPLGMGGPQGMGGSQVMGGPQVMGMAMGNNDMMMQGGNMPYNQQSFGNENGGTYDNMLNVLGNMGIIPNMMMDQNMLYQQFNNVMGNFIAGQPIYVTNAVLLPPLAGVNIPVRREKPPGCKTIFIKGLPSSISDKILRELFSRFGEIIDVRNTRKGFAHIRFEEPASMESAFCVSGYRFKFKDQQDCDATEIFIDYALNREDRLEFERSHRPRSVSPPRVEPCSPTALSGLADRIKSEEMFAAAAPILATWLERGECNKRNVNTFYSLIQASNNQFRRLFNEKMQLDEEFQALKTTMKEKYANIIKQFEQVAMILSAAKIQRAWDHFSKQQRRNIDMWQRMTEDLHNMKEEFNTIFDEDDTEKSGKKSHLEDQLEALKRENEKISYELEGYRNEEHMANEQAERKFEKFKAHFIAQEALKNKDFMQMPLQNTPITSSEIKLQTTTEAEDKVNLTSQSIPPTEARLISVMTAFLLVHPTGASLDYLLSYIRSMLPSVTQATVLQVLQNYPDVFSQRTSGVGASIETRWTVITFSHIKQD